MLVPEPFRARDEDTPWEVMRRHGFAVLVTARAGEPPIASPLPFLADRTRRRLVSHLARRNPQVDHLEAGLPALVVFQGPSAYVSGASYAEQPAVPTWNHVSVHATGTVSVLPDEDVLGVLEDTVAHFEHAAGSDWRLAAEDAGIRRLAGAVLAFAIDVDRIDASFKLSQNIAVDERRRVARRLSAAGQAEVAAWMGRVASVGETP